MKDINALLDPIINFGKVTVSTGHTGTDTTIVLNSGEGAKIPDPSIDGSFNLVWYNSTDYPDPSDDPMVEIIRCITRVIDTIVIMRAQEGTLSSNKNTPGKTYKMILSPTKKTITDIQTDISSAVKKSGDTMTGILNLPSNGIVVGTNQLVVSGGNVGIGTIAPKAKLDILSSKILRGDPTVNNSVVFEKVIRIGTTGFITVATLTKSGTLNGFGGYIKITATGHTAAIGNGGIISEWRNTNISEAFENFRNTSIWGARDPGVNIVQSGNNYNIQIRSADGVYQFNGVVKIEAYLPLDFAGGNGTEWTFG